MVRIILLFVLLLLISVAVGADSLDFGERSGEDLLQDEALLNYAGSALWSVGFDIKIRGNYAYCGMVNGIQVLDISDPINPEIVTQLFLNSPVRSIDIVDTILYAGCSILKILSIGEPTLLKEIGEFQTTDIVFAVKIENNLAYLYYNNGFHIIDVSTPYSCNLVGSVDSGITGYTRASIKIGDGLAYLASNHVYVIDVSNPENPSVLSSYDTPYMAIDLEIKDSLAYIIDLSYVHPAQISSITILNVSNPEFLSHFGGYNVRGELSSIKIIDEYAYVAAGLSGIAIFDISNPPDIFPIGCFPPVGVAGNLDLIDSLMVVLNNKPSLFDFWGYDPDLCSQAEGFYYGDSFPPGASDSGLFLIFDIADAKSPELIGELPHPGFCNFVTVSGDYAFVAGDQGRINIVDISNDDSLKPVCNFRNSIYENKLAADGEILLAADLIYGLQAYDISYMQEPKFLSVIDSIAFAASVELINKYAYITNSSGFWIVDYNDPLKPDVMARCDIPDWPFEFLIDENYAYVTGRSSGFHVVDISNPNNPQIKASSQEQFWCIFLAKKGDILYASGGSIIFIYNVENSLKPKLIGEIASLGIYDISLIDKYLIVARMWDGIDVYEILDDSTLVEVAEYNTPLVSLGLCTDDEYIYNADYGSLIRMRISTLTDVGENTNEYPNIPSSFQLNQNYPNPFNSSTNIEFFLQKRLNVQITVYNILGQEVTTIINEEMPCGRYTVQWDGTNSNGNTVATGLYFYQLKSNNSRESKKMLFLR